MWSYLASSSWLYSCVTNATLPSQFGNECFDLFLSDYVHFGDLSNYIVNPPNPPLIIFILLTLPVD